MIVDAHAHVFPFLGGASGYSSPEEHVRVLQRRVSTYPGVTRRVSDNQLVDEPTLWDGKTPGFEGLLDVNFRIGPYGRFEWEKDGVPYYIQWMPPYLVDHSGPPELLLAQMRDVGVDRALIQRGVPYGLIDDYLSEVVARWPDRFRGCLCVVEEKIHTSAEIEHLRRAVLEQGLTAIYFSNEGFWRGARGAEFSAKPYVPFWEAVQELGVPVAWDIRFDHRRTHADYMGEVVRLQRFARQFPRIRNVVTHGLPAFALDNGGIPDEVIDLLREPNVTLELLFPQLFGLTWEYPYTEAQTLVRVLYEKIGASKMLWGSDMPNTERGCTYLQSLTYLTQHCTFISSSDMDLILGENASEIYFSLTPSTAKGVSAP